MTTLDGPAHLCPVCGAGNRCHLAALTPCKGPCWCERAEVSDEVRRRLPELRGRACLCERCLTASVVPQPLLAGSDFYDENGAVVFTAAYLKRRGFCCGNGCRHCPYDAVSASTPCAPGLAVSESSRDMKH